ncbi:MAG: glycosyltransferase family 4 protein [Saprospiraceae bacterium]
MAYIYHIPSWWPSGKMKQNGVYIYELLKNIALSDKSHYHTVAVFNTSLKWISFKHFFRDLIALNKKDIPKTFESIDNINLLEIPRVIGMNLKTGVNYISKLVEQNIRTIQSLHRKPDLIHVHVSYPGMIIGYQLSKHFNIPFMLTEHSSRFPDNRFELFGVDQIYLKKVFDHSKKNIAVSSFLADKFTPYHVTPDVIHNFVNWDRPLIDAAHSNKTTFSFIWIGRMNDRVKRLDILLNALKILISKGVQCTCTLIGDGELLPYYQSLATQLGVDASMIWVGYASSSEIQSYLGNAHCLVISSESETFGIAAIEALSYGIPVLTTACGGVEEIIDASCGLIVEKNNPDALAIGMQWMMDHADHFNHKQIQDYCYENFDRHSIAEKYVSIYKSIIRA